MQSIAAMHCGRFFAVSSPLDSAQACCRTWRRQCRSRCRKISATRPTISGFKLKADRPGHGLGPLAIPSAIIGATTIIIVDGGAVGPAGGTVAVAYAVGGGGNGRRVVRREGRTMT
jgi:hypothetical protein